MRIVSFKYQSRIISLALLVLVCATFLTACKPSPARIIGKWDHVFNPTPTPQPTPTSSGNVLNDLMGELTTNPMLELPCDWLYPNTIEFSKDHTYTGVDGTFWGGGVYEIPTKGVIKINNGYGKLTTYSYAISGNTLTFTDQANNCTFSFTKSK